MNILTLDVPVPVYSAYKTIVISSVGLSGFNRLGSSFSSRTGISSLAYVINSSRYLVLRLVIPSLTVGICRSVCMTVFGTYHGALKIDLRILFWKLVRFQHFVYSLYPRGECRMSR